MGHKGFCRAVKRRGAREVAGLGHRGPGALHARTTRWKEERQESASLDATPATESGNQARAAIAATGRPCQAVGVREIALLAALLPLLGCATADEAVPAPPAPALAIDRGWAAFLLVDEMSCKDLDGFTLCLPVQPVRIDFSRFDCKQVPKILQAEIGRLECLVAGTLTYTDGRTKDLLPGKRADFVLFPGEKGPVWETSGLYIERIPG
jgi:hypothetical protein